MSIKGIKSQQQYLKKRGLYHGKVDGEWGNASVDAMRGWAYRSDSGNLDGSPFQTAPEGYMLAGDELIEVDVSDEGFAAAAPAPAVVKKAPVAVVKKGVAQPVKKKAKKVVAKAEPIAAPAPKAKAGKVLTRKKVKKVKKAKTPCDGKVVRQSFSVTGRDGDRPKRK